MTPTRSTSWDSWPCSHQIAIEDKTNELGHKPVKQINFFFLKKKGKGENPSGLIEGTETTPSIPPPKIKICAARNTHGFHSFYWTTTTSGVVLSRVVVCIDPAPFFRAPPRQQQSLSLCCSAPKLRSLCHWIFLSRLALVSNTPGIVGMLRTSNSGSSSRINERQSSLLLLLL